MSPFEPTIQALNPLGEPQLSRTEALYAEFADEDRAMAEEGLAEYAQGLDEEDAA